MLLCYVIVIHNGFIIYDFSFCVNPRKFGIVYKTQVERMCKITINIVLEMLLLFALYVLILKISVVLDRKLDSFCGVFCSCDVLVEQSAFLEIQLVTEREVLSHKEVDVLRDAVLVTVDMNVLIFIFFNGCASLSFNGGDNIVSCVILRKNDSALLRKIMAGLVGGTLKNVQGSVLVA